MQGEPHLPSHHTALTKKRVGWKVAYPPGLRLVHVESVSSGVKGGGLIRHSIHLNIGTVGTTEVLIFQQSRGKSYLFRTRSVRMRPTAKIMGSSQR